MDWFDKVGIELYDSDSLMKLLLWFIINFIVAFVIIRVLYYPNHRRKDYLFTYFLFNILIFFLCLLLNSVKLKTGFALGLFAVFSILRYRTEQLPIKEMTYLFIVIGVGVINSLAGNKISVAEILIANGVIIALTFGLEKVWLLKHETRKVITYEKIDLIRPDQRAALIDDLKQRTGLPIHRVQVGKIDFLRDTAQVIIYYYEEGESSSYEGVEQNS